MTPPSYQWTRALQAVEFWVEAMQRRFAVPVGHPDRAALAGLLTKQNVTLAKWRDATMKVAHLDEYHERANYELIFGYPRWLLAHAAEYRRQGRLDNAYMLLLDLTKEINNGADLCILLRKSHPVLSGWTSSAAPSGRPRAPGSLTGKRT
ncbi:MAG: hypothetical protein HY319_10215 [Armatimonadetes bacterium]|nr:hypothetical protein [Armatimonadota bacterium]